MVFKLKYYLSLPLIFAANQISAQQSNIANQTVITIVGDAVESYNTNDFVNTNPYAENKEPQQQQLSNFDQNIEPTLENGFHMRFELESPQPRVRTTSVRYSSAGNSGSSSNRIKHSTSLFEYVYNAKKHLKSWLPERKKRYHPNLCVHF
jgi:hypothetical protein